MEDREDQMTWKTYQGIEVIESQPAPVRHPRHGYKHPTVLKGGSLLLLADETPLVVCDTEGCGYNGITGEKPYVKPSGDDATKTILKQADTVRAHINGMHHPNKPNRRTSFYEDEKLRVIIKIWLKWKHTNIRNWTHKACEELDQMGFKPFRGDSWTAGQLGSLTREQIRKPKFKNLRAAALTDNDKAYLASLAPQGTTGHHVSNGADDHVHVPVDFVKIIEEQEAAKSAQQEEDVAVPAGEPVLTFAAGREETPARTLTLKEIDEINQDEEPEKPVKPSPRKAASNLQVDQPQSSNGFVYVAALPDGSPLFTYKGKLMVGKLIKDVQV